LQGEDNVCRADGLALAHLDDSADVEERFLQVITDVEPDLSVDRGRNALHAATTSQAPDVRLCDAQDGVAKDFPAALLATDLSSICRWFISSQV
jgi:hypothetical protein